MARGRACIFSGAVVGNRSEEKKNGQSRPVSRERLNWMLLIPRRAQPQSTRLFPLLDRLLLRPSRSRFPVQLGPKTDPRPEASSRCRSRLPTSSPRRAPSSPNAPRAAAQRTPNSLQSSPDRAPRRRGSLLKGLPLRQPSSVDSGTAHSLSPSLSFSPLCAMMAARRRSVRSRNARRPARSCSVRPGYRLLGNLLRPPIGPRPRLGEPPLAPQV